MDPVVRTRRCIARKHGKRACALVASLLKYVGTEHAFAREHYANLAYCEARVAAHWARKAQAEAGLHRGADWGTL